MNWQPPAEVSQRTRLLAIGRQMEKVNGVFLLREDSEPAQNLGVAEVLVVGVSCTVGLDNVRSKAVYTVVPVQRETGLMTHAMEGDFER